MITDSKKNFGLSPDQFEHLVRRLEAGDEKIVELIFKSHFEVCRAFLVKSLGASYELAYDISKDTLLKFRTNLLLGKIQYGNLAALYTIDARNTFLRWQEKNKKNPVVGLDDSTLMLTEDPAEESAYDNELVEQLKSALNKIGGDCYELLNWHYYLEMSHRTISEKRVRRGDVKFINEDTVKTKIAECRKSLKKMLKS